MALKSKTFRAYAVIYRGKKDKPEAFFFYNKDAKGFIDKQPEVVRQFYTIVPATYTLENGK